MILMVCVDDNGGMMFHRRRQSRDRRLVERILTLTQGSLLRMNAYSAALFSGHERKQICICKKRNPEHSVLWKMYQYCRIWIKSNELYGFDGIVCIRQISILKYL